MVELTSKYPDTLRPLIESMIAERLRSIDKGIKITQDRIQEFEEKYQMSTGEFLERYSNDEFQHSFDFDEWIGESGMLKGLLKDLNVLRGLEFVD